VGNTSKHLDTDSSYPNDSFDVKCNGTDKIDGLPTDFVGTSNNFENDVAIFAVNYGQQNQNIFKDITLDQSEFPETSETLQITDQIVKKGSANNRTLAGQNIYNVYGYRSYKSEIQMMGNAMVKPMMHFQLNNIPMYHCVYLVTHAKHSIQPNNMSTTFSGVRIRYAKSKIIDAFDMYMSLLDAMDLTNTPSGNSNGTSIGQTAIIQTIQTYPSATNGYLANAINTTNPSDGLKMAKLDFSKITGLEAEQLPDTDLNRYMIAEAIPPLEAMLKAWIRWMKDEGFTGASGKYARITSMYRTASQQAGLTGVGVGAVGFSHHGWGIAIDFKFAKKNGEWIQNKIGGKPNTAVGFDFDQNPSLIWLLDNSHTYGFILPEWARNNTGDEEFWHFEYLGNGAKCMLNLNNIIKGHKVDGNLINGAYDVSVKNPMDFKTKTIPDYSNNCNSLPLQAGRTPSGSPIYSSEADFWTLASVSILENKNIQGRVDVAQSILNRLESKIYPNLANPEITIKGQILSPSQYTSFNNAKTEFAAISDKNSAILALVKQKGWKNSLAKEELEKTVAAFKDNAKIAQARINVGARTDFYAETIKNQIPSNAVDLYTIHGNVFGFFWPGSIAYSKSNPLIAPFPDFSRYS
jgi:hypothetical protein